MTTARQRDVLVHALAADAKLEVEETANRGHAAALACRAMRDGVDVVVALGGDGTVNEVVNGLLTDGVHPEVPALGVVPGGSTNVFARALGLPNDPVEATSVLIDALATGRSRRIGLGLADDRYFLFTAGLGYDAAVVQAVEAHRRRGKTSTHALYVRTAVRTFFAAEPAAGRDPVATAGRQQHRRAAHGPGEQLRSVDVSWATGPVSPTPQASFDSGLDVYTRTRMGVPGVLWSASRMTRRRPVDRPNQPWPPNDPGFGWPCAIVVRSRRRGLSTADAGRRRGPTGIGRDGAARPVRFHPDCEPSHCHSRSTATLWINAIMFDFSKFRGRSKYSSRRFVAVSRCRLPTYVLK